MKSCPVCGAPTFYNPPRDQYACSVAKCAWMTHDKSRDLDSAIAPQQTSGRKKKSAPTVERGGLLTTEDES